MPDHNKISLLVFKNINKPFTILGLAPIAFVIFMIALMVGFIISEVFAGTLFVVVVAVMGKISKENKNGYPDYLNGLSKYSSLKKRLEDPQSYLDYLIKDESSKHN